MVVIAAVGLVVVVVVNDVTGVGIVVVVAGVVAGCVLAWGRMITRGRWRGCGRARGRGGGGGRGRIWVQGRIWERGRTGGVAGPMLPLSVTMLSGEGRKIGMGRRTERVWCCLRRILRVVSSKLVVAPHTDMGMDMDITSLERGGWRW
jgi:hypothetical protein